jgi:Domain of unknown function (DUF4397)
VAPAKVTTPYRRAAPVVLLFVLVWAGLPAISIAQEREALVRVLHLSAETAKVDVYTGGARTLSNIPFKTASRYRPVQAGSHSFEIRASAASPPATATTHASVRAGAPYTLVVLGGRERLQVLVARDDFSAPPAGKAKLRIINGAPQSPPLDIGTAGGPVLFQGVGFGTVSPFAVVPAGSLSLEARAAGTSKVMFSQGASRLAAGTIITVAGTISDSGRIEMLPILDAAGAGALPSGGVATGAGGTAAPAGTVPTPPARTLPALLVLLALLAGAARHGSPGRMVRRR